MVRTRLLMTLVLASLAGAAGSPTMAAEAAPGPLHIDASDGPFVIFAPSPPKPEAIADYDLPDGADDYHQLGQDGAYRIPLAKLSPGRYDMVLEYDGDIDHWAANARAPIRVR